MNKKIVLDKEVLIFPYINLNKIIKMGDFEIHPYKDYDFEEELTLSEKKLLDKFTHSFRNAFFGEGENPKISESVGILKYKGTILRNTANSYGIHDKIKVLFLFLKLHINYDFFNPGMNHIDVRALEVFGFNLKNDLTTKFGHMGECDNLHTTIPENIQGLKHTKLYPISFSINNIPVSFHVIGNGDEVLGVDPNIIDLTYLYEGIFKDQSYYQKFLNISSVHYGLEQQTDLFFYYAIIPSILEVILYPIDINDSKKQKALEYGKKMDELLINDNETVDTLIYVKRNKVEVREDLGIIARTIISIYDMRNDLLHEGKKTFDKMTVNFKGFDLRIYDIFQLIFKFSILQDFVERGIIENNFVQIQTKGNIFTTGEISIGISSGSSLNMDEQFANLVEKAKSDKDLSES